MSVFSLDSILESANFEHLVHCIVNITCHITLKSFRLTIKTTFGVTIRHTGRRKLLLVNKDL